MRKRKPLLFLLFVALFAFISLIYLTFFFPPSFKVYLYSASIPIVPIVFLALFLLAWSLFWFIFADKKRGLFVALPLLIYLMLRFFKLRQPLFLVLIVIIFIGIDYLFRKRITNN